MGEAIINRVTEGPVGPTGPAGPTGAKGATGATGSAGSCNIGYGTFDSSQSVSFSFSPKAVIFFIYYSGTYFSGIAYGSSCFAIGDTDKSHYSASSIASISGNTFTLSGFYAFYGVAIAFG